MRLIYALCVSLFFAWTTAAASEDDDFVISSIICPDTNQGVLEIHTSNPAGDREVIKITYQNGQPVASEVGVAEKEGEFSYWARVNTETEWFSGPGKTRPLGDVGRKILTATSLRGAEVMSKYCGR